MTGRAEVTVIVPFHRDQETLETCLESVAAQRPVEPACILVDDHSEDSSREIAQEFVLEYGWSLVDSAGRGAWAARNTGMAASDSDYLVFLDADDALAPTACHDMATVANEHQADVVTGLQGSMNWQGVIEPIPYLEWIGHYPTGTNLREIDGSSLGSPIVTGKLYRSGFLRESNLEFPALHHNEDTVFSTNAWLRATTVTALQQLVYVRRPHRNTGGLSKQVTMKAIRDRIRASEMLVEPINTRGSEAIAEDNLCGCVSAVLEKVSQMSDEEEKGRALDLLRSFSARHNTATDALGRWVGFPPGVNLETLAAEEVTPTNWLFWKARGTLLAQIASVSQNQQ